MNENEIYKILEITKKKIAISQFREEALEEMNEKKGNKLIVLKKVGIGTAAGILLTMGSVGAYTSITGNTEILKKFGINIEKQYEVQKQYISGEISGKGFTANLVSAACDSSCIVLEIDIDLDENENKYKDIDFKIKNLSFAKNNSIINEGTDLKLSENSVSKITEDGKIKLFKYISIKDPNLAADGFLGNIFDNSDKVECKIEFSKLYDVNTNQTISDGKWNLDFTLEGEPEDEAIQISKKINIQNIEVEIEWYRKSLLGNYIILIATQNKFDLNKENNIQKLEYTIKNSNGQEVKIISKTYNISAFDSKGSKVSIETTLKLDDISDNLAYDVDVKIGEDINIKTSEITNVLKAIKKQQEQEEVDEITEITENNNLTFLSEVIE